MYARVGQNGPADGRRATARGGGEGGVARGAMLTICCDSTRCGRLMCGLNGRSARRGEEDDARCLRGWRGELDRDRCRRGDSESDVDAGRGDVSADRGAPRDACRGSKFGNLGTFGPAVPSCGRPVGRESGGDGARASLRTSDLSARRLTACRSSCLRCSSAAMRMRSSLRARIIRWISSIRRAFAAFALSFSVASSGLVVTFAEPCTGGDAPDTWLSDGRYVP